MAPDKVAKSSWMLTLASIAVVVAALYLAKGLLVPLTLAVLLSFGALGASVGLMAMSAYLISKAALVTGFADLAVAVTAVRALSIARAALRYGERYVSHRATLRF